jgi:hypothetical protein
VQAALRVTSQPSDTPETDALVSECNRALIINASFAAKLQIKCESLERERNAALTNTKP